jgi:PQQ-dependent catabolism-associated CXXCW motif protein
LDHYRTPTPATVTGGVALDTPAAATLWKKSGAVWIDVLAVSERPANLPSSAVWSPVPRRDIPGSLWLPGVGRGALDARLEAYFRSNLDHATGGRADAGVVFYCLADCWMSWNAAKRAASWGYRRVYWFRDGTDGWAAAGLPLAVATPVQGYR